MTVAQGTPRTDADAFWIREGEDRKQYQGNEYVRACVARELERENAALSAQVVALEKQVLEHAGFTKANLEQYIARAEVAEAQVVELQHDLTRHIAIATEHVNRVVELQKVLIYARGALVEVSPCMNPECEQIQRETLDWAIKKLDVVKDNGNDDS